MPSCLHDQIMKQVEQMMCDNVFCYYSFPERIHSDQGANFDSELIAALLQVAGAKKSNMIRTLPPRVKQVWPKMLQTLTFMYNCTIHETTGLYYRHLSCHQLRVCDRCITTVLISLLTSLWFDRAHCMCVFH